MEDESMVRERERRRDSLRAVADRCQAKERVLESTQRETTTEKAQEVDSPKVLENEERKGFDEPQATTNDENLGVQTGPEHLKNPKPVSAPKAPERAKAFEEAEEIKANVEASDKEEQEQDGWADAEGSLDSRGLGSSWEVLSDDEEWVLVH